MSADTTWDQTDAAQVIAGNITVPLGVTLTIEEGVVVKSQMVAFGGSYSYLSLIVEGTLNVNGTEDNPVVFTSTKDTTHGGKTNDSATPAAPGDWGSIKFQEGSTGTVRNAQIYYASSAILATDSSPELTHCQLRNSSIGIQATGSSASPTITLSSIVGNGQGAVAQSGATINASENWWGAADGPKGQGTGSGDSVSEGVDWSDPLTKEP